jgi:hypothetical protein
MDFRPRTVTPYSHAHFCASAAWSSPVTEPCIDSVCPMAAFKTETRWRGVSGGLRFTASPLCLP